MNRRGMTLIQVVVATVVLSILMTGFLQAFITLWNAQKFTVNMPSVQEDSRQMAETLGAAFRRAPLCTSSDTSCTVNAAVQSTATNDVIIYSRPSSTLVQTEYGISGGNFYSKVGAASATTLYTGASLALTYYTSSSYHASTLTSYTPTSTTTPNLIAVGINASITRNGITGTYTTLVRLRNSPLKTSAGQ